MNFIEKKTAYNKLLNVKHVKSDIALLKKNLPDSPILSRGILDSPRAQEEILWALLDCTSQSDIEANRSSDSSSEEKTKAIVEESGIMAASIHNVESLEEKEDVIDKIKELIKPLPTALQSLMLKLPQSITPKAVLKANAIKQLLNLDLSSAKQPELNSITNTLAITVENRKLKTLQAALSEYLLNLPKVDEGDGKEKTEVVADLDTTNTLTEENEDLKDKVEEKEDENAELKNKVEEKEDENTELKDKVEELENESEEKEDETADLKDKVESLENELESEKKNTNQS